MSLTSQTHLHLHPYPHPYPDPTQTSSRHQLPSQIPSRSRPDPARIPSGSRLDPARIPPGSRRFFTSCWVDERHPQDGILLDPSQNGSLIRAHLVRPNATAPRAPIRMPAYAPVGSKHRCRSCAAACWDPNLIVMSARPCHQMTSDGPLLLVMIPDDL